MNKRLISVSHSASTNDIMKSLLTYGSLEHPRQSKNEPSRACDWSLEPEAWLRLNALSQDSKLWEQWLKSGWALLSYEQVQGKGRAERIWSSFPGNLAVSCWVALPQELISPLPLVAGLAVLDALQECGLATAQCKWPNDIYCGGAKLSGILCEYVEAAYKAISGEVCHVPGVVLGIGVNLTAGAEQLAQIDRQAVSLLSLTGRQVTPEKMYELIARALEQRCQRLRQAGFSGSGMAQEWLTHCWHKEQVVVVRAGSRQEEIVGKTVGVGPYGQLLLQQASEVSRQGDHTSPINEKSSIKEVWIGDVERLRLG